MQKEVHKTEEESKQVKAVAMNKLGSWTRWESVQERTLTWQDIWSMEGAPDQVPAMFGVFCPADPIKFTHIGVGRDAQLHTVEDQLTLNMFSPHAGQAWQMGNSDGNTTRFWPS